MMIGHIIMKPVKRFTLGIGGLSRWLFFRFLNAAIKEKYPKDLEYYLDQRNKIIDKNGFTTAEKNGFVGMFFWILFIIFIGKFE